MSDHVLYIIMRDDLDSMNPGKAMAQANHAYGALKAHVRISLPMQQAFLAWMSQTPQEFGTTVVLSAEYEGDITDVLHEIKKYGRGTVLAGWVHDPTYPIRDGRVTHLVPVNTCAYVFGEKEDCNDFVGHLVRHGRPYAPR